MKSLFISALTLVLTISPVWAKPEKVDHATPSRFSSKTCSAINPCATVSPAIGSYTPFWTQEPAEKGRMRKQEGSKT